MRARLLSVFLVVFALAAGCRNKNIQEVNIFEPSPENIPVPTSINYAPPGATLRVGESVTAQVTCKDQQGNAMACPTLTWVSSSSSRVQVSESGVISCIFEGSSEVSVRTPDGGPSRAYVFNCVGSGGTPPIEPPDPTVLFSAHPSSITRGQSSTLSWSTQDADSCEASGSWDGSKPLSGSQSVSPEATSTYRLTCTGPGGTTSEEVKVTVTEDGGGNLPPPPPPPPPAPVLSFIANPKEIIKGQSSSLSWTTLNATACSASGGWSGSKPLGGSENVSPQSTTTYTLTCTGPGGSAQKSVTVQVSDPPPPPPSQPVVTLTATPTSIIQGQHTTLNWTSQHATACTASGGWSGSKPLSGSQSVEPNGTTTYTLTCTGPGGSAQASVTVTVSAQPQAPTCTLTASPMSVPQAGTSTLTWNSSNATSVTKSWSDDTSLAGSVQVVLAETRTFTIVCTGPGGSKQANVTVTVTGPSCPSTIDYSPKGGTIAAGQNKALKVDDWPSAQCMPFWYVDRPSVAQIAGADAVIMIDGTPYYAGVNAVLRGVFQGTVSVCVQTSIVTPEVKRCYTWTVTAAEEGQASLFGNVVAPLKFMYVPGVAQTYPQKK